MLNEEPDWADAGTAAAGTPRVRTTTQRVRRMTRTPLGRALAGEMPRKARNQAEIRLIRSCGVLRGCHPRPRSTAGEPLTPGNGRLFLKSAMVCSIASCRSPLDARTLPLREANGDPSTFETRPPASA